ncbi:MAG TPA: acetoin utilization protein AcuC [Chthonomonadales bacterium]|nr:acetoin utilization protein AcuC [Chthonomonadales bacterium]
MNRPVFLYSDSFQMYDMGPHHPLRPVRLKRTADLLRLLGVLDHMETRAPVPASIDDLRPAHSAEFIESVERLSVGEHVPFPMTYGFGPGDNPVFPDMWEASTLYAGASIGAAQAVLDGAPVAVNISGGLHHAHRARAAGFCVFNDCTLAIHRLLRKYERVAYVDIDAHHGDGVQEAFYADPRVLTVSIHETGHTLFPGTGFGIEAGEDAGVGYNLNLPMWPYTTDAVWLGAWRDAAVPALRAFRPGAVVLQFGADPHYLDPLARLCLTVQGWLEAVRDVKALGVPIVGVGGGGYNQVNVPRMWSIAIAELTGVVVPDEVPSEYELAAQAPTLTDHEAPLVAPHDIERASAYARESVELVRQLVFPALGI